MKYSSLFCFPLLGVLLGLSACEPEASLPEPPRPVLTAVLGAQPDVRAVVYAGEVRSRYETPLAFRIGGKIAARLVDTGAIVKAGDVLARLDPADTSLAVAAVNAQRDLAEADVKRYRELRSKNFVSQAALDARESTFKATRAQTELAQNQSAYTVLRAEQAGVIGLVAADVGQVVAAGQTVFRLARTDALEVAVAIPESSLSGIQVGDVAEVRLWADDQAIYQGVVRELSPVADVATRTFAARVAIDLPDARVRLGMTASVSFPGALPATSDTKLSVPLTAIFQHQGRPAVWLVGNDGTLVLRPVGVTAYGETQAILSDGVAAGERIVIAGVHKLNAGEKIRVVDEKRSAATTEAQSK